MTTPTWNRRRFVSSLAGAPLAGMGDHRGQPRVLAATAAGTPTVSAVQGLQLLVAGNRRYVAGSLTSPGKLNSQRGHLTQGQAPFATVVCCSDSRVPPEVVFDQPLGQLFVIRVAGQVLDEAARSSIMYGVDALKTPLLLVLGHEQCGAVIAAVDALHGTAPPDYAFRFVEGIGPAAAGVLAQPGDVVDHAVRANIKMGVDQLKSSQPVLATAVSRGQVTIVGGYYSLHTGAVTIIA